MGPIEKIVAWLRAGYPDGIPARDYIPLVALLRRRMTDDDIALVGARLQDAGMRSADESHVGAEMLRVLNEVPSPEEIHRVSAQLRADGWPVADGPDPRPVLGPTVHLFYGPAGSGKTTLARQLAAAGAIRFTLGDWMARLYPDLERGTTDYEEAGRGVVGVIWDIARQVIGSGGDVILDWSARTAESRARFVQDARQLGAEVVIHELADDGTWDAPDVRGASVHQPPTEDEGLRILRH